MVTTPRSEDSIFAEALDQPSPEARDAFLDAACGGDAVLRTRIENLLKSHTGAGSFLQNPVPLTIADPPQERVGAMIGSYKLLQQIGEGGMGVVYMAEQEHPVRRRVALKIIKPGMDSRQVIARFEAERQALAMMDHQNIAKVLEAGTTRSGHPYFVMELVHGVPITKFCDDNRLTFRQRLELFVPVCHAIQHAHQKGVIHRDIKPTNILVTMYDDKPVPKVIDFGVAKAVEQRLTEKTLFTQFGALVGTFEYMSPEQAEMNAFGVDTRSDVFSLGVLLYELLTGTTPLEGQRLKGAALAELIRLIKEEEPPRPSVRLSASGTLPKFAAACGMQAGQLPKEVRGELDWIVMKCLEKDRTRRYETVNGLARDVQRYLRDEPVEACPPSLLYRLRKLTARYRGLLMTAASFVALLIMGSMVSVSLAIWAMRAQHQAQIALDGERVAHQQAIDAKEEADQAANRLRKATQIASDGIEYYNRHNWSVANDRFTQAIQIEPGLNTPFIHRGTMYAQLGIWDKAAADYERRFQLANQASAETWLNYLLLLAYTGNEAGYRAACEEMLAQHKSSADIQTQHSVLRACLVTPRPVGEPAELCSMADKLVATANVPWTRGIAGRAYLLAGDFANAEARCREAIKLGTGSPNGVHRWNHPNLAWALYEQGKSAEAREMLIVADQAKEQWTSRMQDGLVGTMPIGWNAWLDFLLVHRQATERITGETPPEDPRLTAIYDRALGTVTQGDVFTLMDAGREYVRQRDWDQAADSFAQVVNTLPAGYRFASQEMQFCVEMIQRSEVFDRLLRLQPNNQHLWFARGRNCASSREWPAAITAYRMSLDVATPLLSSNAERTSWIGWGAMSFELGALLLLNEDRAGYQRLCESILEMPSIDEEPIFLSCISRACTLAPDAIGDYSKPLQWANGAVRKQPRVAWYLYALGIAQHRAGQHNAAIQSLKRSLAVDEGWLGRGQNFAALALANHSLGNDEEAHQWLRKGQSWLNETNRTAANWKFGYAASNYLSDWLSAQVLLREAEQLLSKEPSP